MLQGLGNLARTKSARRRPSDLESENVTDWLSRIREDPLLARPDWFATGNDPMWRHVQEKAALADQREEVRHLADTAEMAITSLGFRAGRHSTVRSEAGERLRVLALQCAANAAGSRETSEEKSLRPGWRYNFLVSPSPDHIPSDRETRRARTAFRCSAALTVISSVLTFYLVLSGRYALAGVVLLSRCALNHLLGQPPSLPMSVSGPVKILIPLRNIYFGCILLHVCDGLLIGCVTYQLYEHGYQLLSLVALVGYIVAVFGSFLRVGAMTIGVSIPRHLFLERLARIGGVLLAVGLAAKFAPVDLVVAPLCFGLYGLIEIGFVIINVLGVSATELSVIVRYRRSEMNTRESVLSAPD